MLKSPEIYVAVASVLLITSISVTGILFAAGVIHSL